jgi:hypothetical protein
MLELFENTKIPVSVMEYVIEPLETMSQDATAKRLFVEKNFKLNTFTKLLDEMDNDSVLSKGANVVRNLATDEDMKTALEGIKNESEESIQYFCHLVGVEKLIPELIKQNPVELILNTMNKILTKTPIKTKPLMHCVNALTSIFKAHPDSCTNFLSLGGLETLKKCVATKDTSVISSIFHNQSKLLELGPEQAKAKIVSSGLVDGLVAFWSGIGKPVEDLFKNIEKFGGKKFIDASYAAGNSKDDKKAAFNSYKEFKSLAKYGFTFIGNVGDDPKIFEKVGAEFVAGSVKLMNGFAGDYFIQTSGTSTLSCLPANEKFANAFLTENFIEIMFREKMSNPLWKRIGLYQERIINKMVSLGKNTITKMIKVDAAKVIVALVHFLDEAPLDSEAEDPTKKKNIPDSDAITNKEREEILSMSDNLIENLIELPTIKKIRTNIEAITKSLNLVPKDDVSNKIRIELATLACANRIEKYAIDATKQDLAYFSEQLGKKICLLKDWDMKVPILSDISKVFNGWIYSTKNELGQKASTDKKVGELYFSYFNAGLEKCLNDKIAASLMNSMSQGLTERVTLLDKAPEEQRPKLTRGNTIIGIDSAKDEPKISSTVESVTRMMKQFPNNVVIQTAGCQIIKCIALLSTKMRLTMNETGAQKYVLSVLNNEQLTKEVHFVAMETIEVLAQGDKKNLESIAKQKGLSSIFKSLKIHNSDEDLANKAEGTLKLLMEQPEAKADMAEDFREKVKELAKHVETGKTDKVTITKCSGLTSSISGYLMNETMAGLGDDNGKLCVESLKKFWSMRRSEDITLTGTPKLYFDYVRDTINISKAAQRQLKTVKHGDSVAIANFKGSGILDDAIQSFKKYYTDVEITSNSVRLIAMALEIPDLTDDCVDKCYQAEIVEILNKSFELHKGNFDLMKDLITVAVELCIKYPDVATKIDGKALIKQLMENGKLFLKNGLEEGKNMANTKSVINCLRAFSKTQENLEIMKDNGGQEYFIQLKNIITRNLCKKTTYNFTNCHERINKVKTEQDELFEEGKMKGSETEKAIAVSLIEVLDRYNEQYNIMTALVSHYMDFGLFTLEYHESTKVVLTMILRYLSDKKLKDSIPTKEIMKAVIGIKNKHAKNPDIPALCDEILKNNDVGEMLKNAITAFEKTVEDGLNEESKKVALNKLNDIRGLITLSTVKEEKIIIFVERIMKPCNKLMAKFDKDIGVLDGVTSTINRIAEKGEKAQAKLINQESEDLLTKMIFWSPEVLINAGKEKADGYLFAYAKVMNDKVMEPFGKKQVELNLAKNEVNTKKEEEKLDDSVISKSKIWAGKEKQLIVNTFNQLMNPKNPKRLAAPETDSKKSATVSVSNTATVKSTSEKAPNTEEAVAGSSAVSVSAEPSEPSQQKSVTVAPTSNAQPETFVKKAVDRKFGFNVPKKTFTESLATPVPEGAQKRPPRHQVAPKFGFNEGGGVKPAPVPVSTGGVSLNSNLRDNLKKTNNLAAASVERKPEPTNSDEPFRPMSVKELQARFAKKDDTPIELQKGQQANFISTKDVRSSSVPPVPKASKSGYPTTQAIVPSNKRTGDGIDPRDFNGFPQCAYDPLTARPMNAKLGKPFPIDKNGRAFDPATKRLLPGYYDPATGQHIDVDTNEPFKLGFDIVTGRPLDENGEEYPLDEEGYPYHPETRRIMKSVKFDKTTGRPIDPETNQPLYFDRFDPYTGRILNVVTNQPLPVHPKFRRQFDPKTGKLFPGTYDPHDLRPIDPKTGKKFYGGYDPETGRPVDPRTGKLFELDAEGRPFDVQTNTIYPGRYDKKTGKALDPETGHPVYHMNFCPQTGIPINPDTRKPYPIQFGTSNPHNPETGEIFPGHYEIKNKKLINPDTKVAYEIAGFDEESGAPLGADGNLLPYDAKEMTFSDMKGVKIHMKFHPESLRPIIDMTTMRTFTPKNYCPDTGRPLDPATGKLAPLDPATNCPYDSETGIVLPGRYDLKTGQPLDDDDKIFAVERYCKETGVLLDPSTKKKLPVDLETHQVMDPVYKVAYPFKFYPKTYQMYHPGTKEVFAPNFDPTSGKPINYKTDEPYPVDEKTGRPFDPQSGKILPGLYDNYEGEMLDPKTREPIKLYDKYTGRPINPVTKAPYPIDPQSYRPYDPKTKKYFPGFFDPTTGDPVDKDTRKIIKLNPDKNDVPINLRNNYPGTRFKQVNKDSNVDLSNQHHGRKARGNDELIGENLGNPHDISGFGKDGKNNTEVEVGRLPGWPRSADPDELNRRPGGKYNPHNGRPIDPVTGREYPISAAGQPYDPVSGDIYPGLFDPLTGQPINPETKKPIAKAFDPRTGRPLHPETGQPFEIDPSTKYPLDPETKKPVKHAGQFDPSTGRKIDPKTGQPEPASFDPKTGRPVNAETGDLYPIDKNTGQPFCPRTGRPFPGKFDPTSGKPLDPATGQPSTHSAFDPDTGRPLGGDGKPVPIDIATGVPTDPSGKKYPGVFNPHSGLPFDPVTGLRTPDRYDPDNGVPVDPLTNTPMLIDDQTQSAVSPYTGLPVAPGMQFDPATGQPVDPESKAPIPDRFDPKTGRPLDKKGQPYPVDPATKQPFDPVTKKKQPGAFNAEGKPVDPKNKEKVVKEPEVAVPGRNQQNNYVPRRFIQKVTDPLNNDKNLWPKDKFNQTTTDKEFLDLRDPRRFVQKVTDTFWPDRPHDASGFDNDPKKKSKPEVGLIPGWPKSADPDELNRRPGGRYNPHNGRPIDPVTGREYPLNAQGTPYDPETGEVYPGHFDPLTGQPMNPETKKPIAKAFDPRTGRPLHPETGQPFEIDPSTKYPLDPDTKKPVKHAGQFDPATGRKIDPKTGQPEPASFDPKTGRPINIETGQPFPIDKVSGQPFCPRTGRPFPGKFDPITGQPVDILTGQPIPHDKFDPDTGRPLGGDGKPVPIDMETGIPTDPSGKKYPGVFNPYTGLPYDPVFGIRTPDRYDPDNGLPVDHLTNTPVLIDDQTKSAVNPYTGKPVAPGVQFDPLTGQPVDPESKAPIPDRFDPKTGRPLDKKGQPYPVDPATKQPFDPVTKKKQPGAFNADGKPVDPKNKEKVLRDPEPTGPARNLQNNYVPRRFIQKVTDPTDNEPNNWPKDKYNQALFNPQITDLRDPKKFVQNPTDRFWPDRPVEVRLGEDGKPLADPNKVGLLPGHPKGSDPDELNRRPGGRYNPHNGRPIDPVTGREYPLNAQGQPYDPVSGDIYPGLFDPLTGQPINPETKKPIAKAFDPRTGRPLHPETGQPFEIDPSTKYPLDPDTKKPVKHAGQFDPTTGRKIDPKTGQPEPASFDPKTGRPVNAETGDLYPIDKNTGQPFCPRTGRPFPGKFDPTSGKPLDPATGQPSTHSAFDPDTGRPLGGDGKPVPIDIATGVPTDPSGKKYPGVFNPHSGLPFDPVTGLRTPDRYDPDNGVPVDPLTNTPMLIDDQTQSAVSPYTGLPVAPGMQFDPATGQPVDPESKAPIPDRFDPKTGRPLDKKGQPYPVDPATKQPFDPVTKKKQPGAFNAEGKPVDPKNKEKVVKEPEAAVPGRNQQNNYVPRKFISKNTDPLNNEKNLWPKDKYNQALFNPTITDMRDPKRFNPNPVDRFWPDRPYDASGFDKDPKNKSAFDPGRLPGHPAPADPDEFNRRPGGKYNPHNGRPIDPVTGREYPISAAGQSYDPVSGDIYPGLFDPLTGQPINPETKKPIAKAFDPRTGRPLHPETGQPLPIDQTTKYPIDPDTKKPVKHAGQFDPSTGRKIDPKTGQPEPASFDPKTGRPVNAETGDLYPIDKNTGQPFCPRTGRPFPGKFDPTSGKPLDPATGQPSTHSAFDPDTGRPLGGDGKPVPIDIATGVPTDPSGKKYPGVFNPHSGLPFDPVTGLRTPDRYDPDNGVPVDPLTNTPMLIDDQTQSAVSPYTGLPVAPGMQFDPATGQPVDPDSKAPIPDRFDPKTGRPLDKKGQPYPVDPATKQPFDPVTKKKQPGAFNAEGKPVDPKNKEKVMKEPEAAVPGRNQQNNYVPRKFIPKNTDPLNNEKNLWPKDKYTQPLFNPTITDLRDPKKFAYDPIGRNWPGRPHDASPFDKDPKNKSAFDPGRLPGHPAPADPDEFNRRPGGKYNPHNGRPIDPVTGREYPISAAGQPYDPVSGDIYPGLFDPLTGQPINPETGKPIAKAFHPTTGRPLHPETGQPLPIDQTTKYPIDPDTKKPVKHAGQFDPTTGRKIDPKTGQPEPAAFDPKTGRPVNAETGELYPIDKNTGQPFCPRTGRPFPGKFDPTSGKPLDPATGQPSTHSAFDPDTGRPLGGDGKPVPIDIATGVPTDPSGKKYPGVFNPHSGLPFDPVTGLRTPDRYDPDNGVPVDPLTNTPMLIDDQTQSAVSPYTGQPVAPGMQFDPATGQPVDPESKAPIPDRFDPKTGRPLDKKGQPYPVDPATKQPFDPVTKKKQPGAFNAEGKPVDPKNKEKVVKEPEAAVPGRNQQNNYVPRKFIPKNTDPLNNEKNLWPKDKYTQVTTDPTLTDLRDPKKFAYDPTGRNWPGRPHDASPFDKDPKNKSAFDPGRLPGHPAPADPDEFNRRPGGKYNPHNGRPIDPVTGREYPISAAGQPYDPVSGDIYPGLFDPLTGQPINPETGKPIAKAFHPTTGRPLHPETGQPLPIDQTTKYPIDPETKKPVKHAGQFDPTTGRKIDPKTGQPEPAAFDPKTGRPVNAETGDLYPIDKNTGQPFCPRTGRPFPGKFDPTSGKPLDPATGQPSTHSAFDPDTGRPLGGDGKPVPIDIATGVPTDPSGKKYPGVFNPHSGLPFDPVTGLRTPDRYDPDNGVPVDPLTNTPMLIDDQTQSAVSPYTGLPVAPGMQFDPATGQPVDPESKAPIPDRFDPKTGRPLDKKGQPYPVDPAMKQPFDPVTKKKQPGAFNAEGKPVDPKNKEKVVKEPEVAEPGRNQQNNYVPRRFIQKVTDPLNNDKNLWPKDKFNQILNNPTITDLRDPKKFTYDPVGTKWPDRPHDSSGFGKDPKNKPSNDPGRIPNLPKPADPDEFNRRPGGKYNPHNGRPIDPATGREYPINADGRPHDPKTGEIFPGVFDPKTGQPLNPETNKPLPKAFDPRTGRPLNPETGEPLAIDPESKLPVDAKTKKPIKTFGKFDPETGRKLDEKTGQPEPAAFDPKTGRPIDLDDGLPYPIDKLTGHPYNPDTGALLPGKFDPVSGKPVDSQGKPVDHDQFDPDTGRPLGKDGKPIPLSPEGIPTDEAGKKYPGVFDPTLGTPVDLEKNLTTPNRYDPDNGIPIDPTTNAPLPVNPTTKAPFNPRTGKIYPGKHDPETGNPIDADTEKPIPDRFDPKTAIAIDPKTKKAYPIDPKTNRPFDPLTSKKKPGNFDKSGKPLDPKTLQPINPPHSPDPSKNSRNNYVPRKFIQTVTDPLNNDGQNRPNKFVQNVTPSGPQPDRPVDVRGFDNNPKKPFDPKDPGRVPQWPKGTDPDEFNRRPGGKYNPHNGRPIDPMTGKEYPLNAEGRPHDPKTGDVLPGQFDPKTGQPINPDTNKPIPKAFDPRTGRPLNPEDGKPMPIDSDTKYPYDPKTKAPVKTAGKFDPATGRKLDETTGKPEVASFDPKTGRPINPDNGEVFPIDKATGHPYHPETGLLYPGKFDPVSGKPLDPTGKPVDHDKFDPDSGRPLGPDNKPIPLNEKGIPTDPAGKTYPGVFDPITNTPIDPVENLITPNRYDPDNGVPVDAGSNTAFPVDPQTKNPFNPFTGKKFPGKHDPDTGLPLDPDTNKPIPDRFDPKSSIPLNPRSGKPYTIDPKTNRPTDPLTSSKKPGLFDQKGKPLDPKTMQPGKAPRSPDPNINTRNNYIPRKFVQVLKDSISNDPNNFKGGKFNKNPTDPRGNPERPGEAKGFNRDPKAGPNQPQPGKVGLPPGKLKIEPPKTQAYPSIAQVKAGKANQIPAPLLFDPMTARPMNPVNGTQYPLDEKGIPHDPTTGQTFPGKFDKEANRQLDPTTNKPIPAFFDPKTGIPIGRDGKEFPINPDTGRPTHPVSKQAMPGVFDPKTKQPVHPDTREPFQATPGSYCPNTGRPKDKNGNLVPIHPTTFRPTDPETSEEYPGCFDPQTNQPIDPYTLEPIYQQYDVQTGLPLDENGEFLPIDSKTLHPQNPKTKQLLPGSFDPLTGVPVHPDTKEKFLQPPGAAVMPVPTLGEDPADEEEVIGVIFNPDTGRPIDATGKEIPLNKNGNPEHPITKQVFPMDFDKDTGRVIDPETKKPVPTNYDPFTGRPIDSETGKPYEIDPKTRRPTKQGVPTNLPGIFDPKTGMPIDPETNQALPANFDETTGRPINPITAKMYPIDPVTKQPFDPRTGENLPGLFDPETGKPIVQSTGKISEHDKFDPITGMPVKPDGEKYPINSKNYPHDPALGELPGKFDPVDLRQVDPVTGKKAPAKFDPAMGMPIDPSTGAPFPIGTDNKPYDPISQKKMPGLFDPKTGRPINPTTGAAIPDKFNYKTGRPIDPLTGKPFPINEKGEPIDEAKNKKAAPCKFDPKTGVPTDKTFKPMNLNKPAKPEDLARRNPNETGNYHGRKFEPNVAPRLDNTKNNYKPRERKPSAEVAKPVEEEKKIGKLNPIKPGEGQTVPLNKTPKLTPVPNPKKVIDPTRLNYKPKDFVEEMTAIPQEESGRDMVLALADIWAKNPQAAEAFCNPETFSALNGLLEEARKTPDETARDELEDKIHCMVKNLINVLPEEAEKRAEILRPMELKNILPLISRKIDRIDETPENMKDDPVLRMKKIEDVEAALDVMEKVWTAAKDKGPFLEEDIPFKLLDKMDKLNCLGPEEAEKSGMAATMIADLAQAVNPMLNHPATGKYCQDLGALPILQNTLENLQDAKPLKPGQVQPKEVNINKPIKLSKKALDAALQSAVNAFKDLTGNKKVAGFIPLQPETPGNTFALLNEIAKANPDDPIVVSKASEAMANILKSHPVEDVKPIVPFLEKLHKDIMTIHSQFPTNPCTTDLLATVEGQNRGREARRRQESSHHQARYQGRSRREVSQDRAT